MLGHLPDVAVAVDPDRAAGQAAPVDDRGVVQLIGDDRHAWPAYYAEAAEIGGKAGREQQGPVGALPRRAFSFQLGMHRSRASDEPRRAGPCTPAVDRLMSRRPDRRMLGQPEVVIGRERDHLEPVHVDERAAAVQLPDRPPAVTRDDIFSFGKRPAIPAHRHTSRREKVITSTIRSISAAVVTSGSVIALHPSRGESAILESRRLSSLVSRLSPGLAVVSSRSPRKMLLAPA